VNGLYRGCDSNAVQKTDTYAFGNFILALATGVLRPTNLAVVVLRHNILFPLCSDYNSIFYVFDICSRQDPRRSGLNVGDIFVDMNVQLVCLRVNVL